MLTGVMLLILGACQSPEDGRKRGGGPGADVGNRDAVIQLHAGSKMYYGTPCLMPKDRCTGPRAMSGLPGDFPEPRRKSN